jgi:hypothetical protein
MQKQFDYRNSSAMIKQLDTNQMECRIFPHPIEKHFELYPLIDKGMCSLQILSHLRLFIHVLDNVFTFIPSWQYR